MKQFGELIRAERMRQGFSVAKLGEISEIPASTIRKYESGCVQATLGQANDLLCALGITMVLGQLSQREKNND